MFIGLSQVMVLFIDCMVRLHYKSCYLLMYQLFFILYEWHLVSVYILVSYFINALFHCLSFIAFISGTNIGTQTIQTQRRAFHQLANRQSLFNEVMKKILYIIITESLSSLIRPRWCFSGFASPLSQKLYVSTDMEAMTMRKCRQCLFIFDF